MSGFVVDSPDSIPDEDSDLSGFFEFEYDVNGTRGIVSDDVYKFPCPCGGSRTPERKRPLEEYRKPDVHFKGKCGGTVMLLVGEDNAMDAYGIKGQSIALDIVH